MGLRSIRQYPDPVLRVRCRPVEQFGAELRELVTDMRDTMYAAPGVGLAAPQVGVESRVTVVDVSEDKSQLKVLVNPEIIDSNGRDTDFEGCLSIPGITEKVERPCAVVVQALDVNGREYELAAEGLLARALCHEIDHLDGILFFDHLAGLRKQRVRRFLRRLERAEEGVTA